MKKDTQIYDYYILDTKDNREILLGLTDGLIYSGNPYNIASNKPILYIIAVLISIIVVRLSIVSENFYIYIATLIIASIIVGFTCYKSVITKLKNRFYINESDNKYEIKLLTSDIKDYIARLKNKILFIRISRIVLIIIIIAMGITTFASEVIPTLVSIEVVLITTNLNIINIAIEKLDIYLENMYNDIYSR